MKRRHRGSRNGSIAGLFAILLPVVVGVAAFAIDIGRIGHAQARLQSAADAAALAAAEELPNSADAITAAKTIGGLNLMDHSNVVTDSDVEFGKWDDAAKTFTVTTAESANAVRVTARLSDTNGNSLSLFFGSLLGRAQTDISAVAIAAKPPAGVGVRFLIDDEMVDKDEPAIEALARHLGRDPEELVTARGFNDGKKYGRSNWTWEDNFLDIPAGSQLSLPTGQGTSYDNNDAGIFDIDFENFTFSDPQDFQDFVMYSESGGDNTKWGTDKGSILNKLDPLKGVSPVTDDSIYPSFVNPDFVHISPIFESDISTLEKKNGVGQINAKGQRRGLLAFKIMEVGPDKDSGGSLLPELVIEIVDPATTTIDDLKAAITTSGGGDIRIVQ